MLPNHQQALVIMQHVPHMKPHLCRFIPQSPTNRHHTGTTCAMLAAARTVTAFAA